MKELYKELQERLKELEGGKETTATLGRIAELQLVIIRVQQFLLKDIKPNEQGSN